MWNIHNTNPNPNSNPKKNGIQATPTLYIPTYLFGKNIRKMWNSQLSKFRKNVNFLETLTLMPKRKLKNKTKHEATSNF